MRLLAISGSLRKASANTALLVAAGRLTPPGWEVVLFDGLAALPYFNPDLETDEPPAQVLALREQVGSAEGLLLCSPEYARGVAGAFKNALDWLVGSVEFPGKPVALFNASPRATSADAQLRLTLQTMSARLVEDASVTLALLGRSWTADDIVSNETMSAALRAALVSLTRAIAAMERAGS